MLGFTIKMNGKVWCQILPRNVSWVGGGSSCMCLASSYKKAKPGTALEPPLLAHFAPLLRPGTALQQAVQLQGCTILPCVPIHLLAEMRNICWHGRSEEHPRQATPCPVPAAALPLGAIRRCQPGPWGLGTTPGEPEQPRQAQTRLKTFGLANACRLQEKGLERELEERRRAELGVSFSTTGQVRAGTPSIPTAVESDAFARPGDGSTPPSSCRQPLGGAASPSPLDSAGAAKVPAPRSLLQPQQPVTVCTQVETSQTQREGFYAGDRNESKHFLNSPARASHPAGAKGPELPTGRLLPP